MGEVFSPEFTSEQTYLLFRKMHQDLLDAIDFLVANKIVDRRQVAIMGKFF